MVTSHPLTEQLLRVVGCRPPDRQPEQLLVESRRSSTAVNAWFFDEMTTVSWVRVRATVSWANHLSAV